MRKTLIALFLAFGVAPTPDVAAQQPVTKANYALAEQFSPAKIDRMVYSTEVSPHWFRDSDRFWYSYRTSEGVKYYLVDPVARTKRELFDLADLAARITEITGDPFDSQHLPLAKLELKDDKYLTFEIRSTLDEEKKEEEKDDKKKGDRKKPGKKIFRFRYDLASAALADITSEEKEKEYPQWASISPDGEWAVYCKRYDLYYMDRENLLKVMKDEKDSTVMEHRLTTDGERRFSYGYTAYDPYATDEEIDKRTGAGIVWSPDSRRFALVRNDSRKIKDLWVIDVLAQPRPKLETYQYQMPGEEGPVASLYLFDFANKTSRVIRAGAFKEQTVEIQRKARTHADRYEKPAKRLWLGDDKTFYFTRTSRDLKRIDLCAVDVDADSCRTVVAEKMNTSIENRAPRLVNGGSELLHWSERNGWAHLYRYTADGRLLNALTRGEWHVDQILGADDKTQTVYFTANGREEGNPYYTYVYSVRYDGTGLKLLCDVDLEHGISLADDTRFFVDNSSRVDTTPSTVLRNSLGQKVMDLETADFSQLLKTGYRFPERFTVKAGDGVTDLYGVMYKPFDFDSTRCYPIIEYVYPGPQTEAVNTAWNRSMNRVDRLAQLGFVVITVGNRGGHPSRSKWYHNYGYGNLRDYGLEDKKVAVQQLAARHNFIDGERVGITGHSGGGFMSTAAILKYPDFFKVAVSCAGNHDNSIYNRWWSEKHHGVKEVVGDKGDTTFLYSIANNQQLARNLKGRLLLVTGDIDNNVHPGNTMRVVNALIRANKRFDMLVLPGQRHGFGDMNEYYFWRMADYFSEHLLGDSQKSVDIPQLNND